LRSTEGRRKREKPLGAPETKEISPLQKENAEGSHCSPLNSGIGCCFSFLMFWVKLDNTGIERI
jgi:hypothetical protein